MDEKLDRIADALAAQADSYADPASFRAGVSAGIEAMRAVLAAIDQERTAALRAVPGEPGRLTGLVGGRALFIRAG